MGFMTANPLEQLPIDPLVPQVVGVLRKEHTLLITAPPGAGKTTRIPRALYDAGFAAEGEIIVLEPRRLATRLAAGRVAFELGQKPGTTVGYTVRFESVGGRDTLIRFVTEGILARRIVQDPLLKGVSTVILDEFHERHLATDLALAYLRRLQRTTRPDLRLLVMSATLETSPLSAFLDDAPILSAEGGLFEVRIEYEEKASDQPLDAKIARATRGLLEEKIDGDLLAFLPGAAEIRRTSQALAPLALQTGMLVVPLHGDLPPASQAAAIAPATHRKLILATNVAETSITIPGVAAVIDSGLARIASYSAWSGLPMLRVGKISKASAIQRAGRAGRTRHGRALRLYTRGDFNSRAEHDLPEIRRADLAETLLTLHGAGITDVRTFPWFESPPASSVDAAEELLRRLGAFDGSGNLTSMGRRMLRFPTHPRLARMIAEGEEREAARDACLLAALLMERDIRLESRSNLGARPPRSVTRHSADSDLLELRDCFREAEGMGFARTRVASLGLDPGALERVRRGASQLERLVGRDAGRLVGSPGSDESLRIATLAGFPDRVAKRRTSNSRDLVLSAGGSARLSEESVVHKAPLMVAVDATERGADKTGGPGSGVLVRLASAIEPEWLAALFPDELQEQVTLAWNPAGRRVEEVRRIIYGRLALEESTRPAPPSKAAAGILAEAAFAANMSCFPDIDDLGRLQLRLGLLVRTFPEENFPSLDPAAVREAVAKACSTRTSLAELMKFSLCRPILAELSARQQDLLRRETPERISLGTRHSVPVHYESGKPPWIESRLQDFFRLRSTPSICRGRVPLTIHLLAPNGRAVQVTQDLAGFWKRHYPEIRRELQRRYPKHAWPDPEDLE